jgi:hypothetical protein
MSQCIPHRPIICKILKRFFKRKKEVLKYPCPYFYIFILCWGRPTEGGGQKERVVRG